MERTCAVLFAQIQTPQVPPCKSSGSERTGFRVLPPLSTYRAGAPRRDSWRGQNLGLARLDGWVSDDTKQRRYEKRHYEVQRDMTQADF